jgi:DNA-binding response OmpR family regulator
MKDDSVLVIDDETDVAAWIAEGAEELGFALEIVPSAAAAAHLLARHVPSTIAPDRQLS